MKVVILLAALCVAANAQSVKSCGTATDILKNAVFTVTPDPIVKGSPLTVTATGTLSAALVGGSFKVDLAIKALGIINTPVKTTSPFSLSPGVAAGDTKIVIGPLTLPKIPGSTTISGTVTGADASGAQIFCLALDMSMFSAVQEVAPIEAAPVVTSCGADADHLKNISVTTAGGVNTMTGTLDEDVTTGNVPVDLTVQVSFFKIPISMNVPFSLPPKIPAGPVKVSLGPASPGISSNIAVKVDGTVKINDDKTTEIACIQVTTPAADRTTVSLMPAFATAATSHYEDPKPNGCQSDELAIQIQGISGDFCSPKCSGTTCPSDVPSGVTAAGTCALQDTSGNKYCALICSPGANDGACGTATCKSIQGTGICTYDD